MSADLCTDQASRHHLLEFLASARLPLQVEREEVDARCAAYRDLRSGHEYLAVTVGRPETGPSPLVRVHSGCLTGDVLGSMRCDCGEQLAYTLKRMAGAGAGTLVYAPAHEGRGIGIANKIRAYALQDVGYDTVDANAALGLEVDARDFAAAAHLLILLGHTSVSLLTNNPSKVEALIAAGLEVTRAPMPSFPNSHNLTYLTTKRHRLGHEISTSISDPVP